MTLFIKFYYFMNFSLPKDKKKTIKRKRFANIHEVKTNSRKELNDISNLHFRSVLKTGPNDSISALNLKGPV